MRVAINCRSFLKKHYTGIGRYAYHLVKSLGDIDQTNEYQLYVRKSFFNFNKNLPNFPAQNFIPRIDWFNRGLAKMVKDVDVYHFPSPGPLDAPSNAKIVVTVHDLIFKVYPAGHTEQTIEAGQKQFQQIKEKASKIICCSQSTVTDLKQYFRIPDERIALVYQGVDRGLFYRLKKENEWIADQVLKEKGVKSPFILFVGTIEPRKNLINLIHAFHKLRIEGKFLGSLVVAGMKGWMLEDIGALVKKLELTEHIIFLGFLTDRELCYLYNKTEVFVFPSFYEGFGFPIIEAFCCGAPVVTSNISSCPEIAGDAAITVNPNSSADIAEAINRIIGDSVLKELLRSRGERRAEEFSFHKTASKTLEVYKEVCGI